MLSKSATQLGKGIPRERYEIIDSEQYCRHLQHRSARASGSRFHMVWGGTTRGLMGSKRDTKKAERKLEEGKARTFGIMMVMSSVKRPYMHQMTPPTSIAENGKGVALPVVPSSLKRFIVGRGANVTI
eukprot:3625928-Rhodomonas_salina.1